MEPVDILREVVPRHRRQCLLVLECVGHVVIRNVGVGGGVVWVIDELGWVDELERGADLGCDGRSGDRHAWR